MIRAQGRGQYPSASDLSGLAVESLPVPGVVRTSCRNARLLARLCDLLDIDDQEDDELPAHDGAWIRPPE